MDIRGTGASEGFLIKHEYSSQELDDCVNIIEQLAKNPYSNGNVGMFGISWSAFNSLMMATLRRPPALKAIFAVHGTHDLYKSDIHYPDGIMHLDDYLVSIDHANALPSSPHYLLDDRWIEERLTQKPWIHTHLAHQLEDSFWKEHSIRYAYDNFTLPVYLIAGLYDA